MKIKIITEIWLADFDTNDLPSHVTYTTEGTVAIVTETIDVIEGARIEIVQED